ncbi:LysE family transporter [Polaribacter sargassicola]|uniref:LysE family transporter n=1 Tax=Polaribacter sargassicola TaxID=2836891 RepID=UPI001F027F3B|nr:LysE family transporter [Polaribacter sp. DS7-9]MCG1035127.1 LysE family transporter [Polaribacter sp. DS7-9]
MISLFLFGFVFSFLGFTLPSVLNMTALKIRLDSNKKEFIKFTTGVSVIVFLQVFTSIYIIKYLSGKPYLIEILEKTGVVVLLILSIYFYKQHKKERKEKVIVRKNSFLMGIILSTLNMFAIPFFCGTTAFLISYNFLNFNTISVLTFVLGTVLGTYYILYLYGKFALKIQEKTGNLTNNINLILSFITAGFALFTVIKFII